MVIREFDDLCMGCMSINKTGSTVCPQCGFDSNTQYSSLVLPYRTILNKKFLIGKVLGKGGFGITYLAWDLVLQTAVAIKEYLPSTLVARENQCQNVEAHSDQDRTEFEYGLKQFLQEARTLAQFSHNNVVRVREFFAANKTAYLVMDYYKGVSLTEFLHLKDYRLSEQDALKIMLPILNGLAQVHQKGFLHRDIKPDNIYLVDNAHPVLLDFGAARSALGHKSLSLSVILTPGFAPFEQYMSNGEFTPSTDIYSVAATIYYMTTGIKPHEATTRLQNDPIIHLANLEPSLSRRFADSVMKALSVYPEHRPQSIEEFQQQLTEQPPAGNQVNQEAPYNPAYNKRPSVEAEACKLDTTKVDNSLSPRAKKYNTCYCPRCKTKNVIPEGKPLSEASCINCRQVLGEKANKPVSPVLIRVSLVLILALFAYRFVIQGGYIEPAIKHTPPVPAANASSAPVTAKTPEPAPDQLAEPITRPESKPEPEPEQKLEQKPESEQKPELMEQQPTQADKPSPPSLPTLRPLPRLVGEDGLPKIAPQFAVDACVGKAVGDSCLAQSPRLVIPGVCRDIRDALACIPNNE